MNELATIGGAVIAVSACASGVCMAIAYHVPATLKDGLNAASSALKRLDDPEGSSATPDPHKPASDL